MLFVVSVVFLLFLLGVKTLSLVYLHASHSLVQTHGLTDPMPLLQPSNLDVEEARQWKHFMRSNDCYRELGW